MSMYKYLVMAHLLGSAAWIGGHLVLLGVVLPDARRAGSVEPVVTFERRFGRIGLPALVVQVATGLMLASNWVFRWRGVFSDPSPAARLILAKIGLLAVLLALAAHSTHRVLPGLSTTTLGRFTVHAWIVTVLSMLIMVLGVGVRTGGLLP